MNIDERIDKDFAIKAPKVWYFIAVLSFFIIAGIIAIWQIGSIEDARLRASFKTQTQAIAAALDTETVASLSGSSVDLDTQSYQKIKSVMHNIKSADPSARFVYLMGYNGTDLFFFVDSESPDSIDYSAPGDIYTESTEEEIAVYKNKQPLVQGPYTDRWGQWVSATAPILNESGNVIATLGIDISSSEWTRQLRTKQSIPAIILVALLIISSLFFINRVQTSLFIKRLQKYNEIIRQFASFASHQLRTPLTAIKWTTEKLMQDENKLSAPQNELLGKIKSLDHSMLSLIKDFLDMSSVQQEGRVLPKKELIDIGKLAVKAVVDNNSEAVRKSITVMVNNRLPEVFRIAVDYEQIYSCIDNLVNNAIKYSPQNSKIYVSLDIVDSECILSIQDSGIGIPPGDQKNLFTTFYRASNVDSQSVGTGIGLYMVKLIMEAHGGRVAFESEHNKGSTFSLIFPIV